MRDFRPQLEPEHRLSNAVQTLLLIGGMMFLWLPGLRRAAKNSPKGTAKDWMGVLVPIALVVLFLFLLISFV